MARNVRELENAVEFGTNMAFGDTIGIDDVPRPPFPIGKKI